MKIHPYNKNNNNKKIFSTDALKTSVAGSQSYLRDALSGCGIGEVSFYCTCSSSIGPGMFYDKNMVFSHLVYIIPFGLIPFGLIPFGLIPFCLMKLLTHHISSQIMIFMICDFDSWSINWYTR